MTRVRAITTGSSETVDCVVARVCVDCTRREVIIEVMVICLLHS